MKLVISIVAFVLLLMVWAVADSSKSAQLRAELAARKAEAFNCRAPLVAGDFTVITVRMRNGVLVGDCDYLTTMPKKGG